jgi:hypothetical protein
MARPCTDSNMNKAASNGKTIGGPRKRCCVGIRAGILLLLAAVFAGHAQGADEIDLLEYKVKMAFLYNFAKFVEWPATAFKTHDSPLVIGILGDTRLPPDLEQAVKGRTVNGRQVIIHRSKSIEDLLEAHVLFISYSEQADYGRIMRMLNGRGVLTVGESPEFLRQGGVINFVLRDNKVRFEIDRAAAEREGLRISSQLLKLAVATDAGESGRDP